MNDSNENIRKWLVSLKGKMMQLIDKFDDHYIKYYVFTRFISFIYNVGSYAYISMIFKYHWFNPSSLPSFNTSLINELLWLYNSLDSLLAHYLCNILLNIF